MNTNFLNIILNSTKADKIHKIEDIQTLWSGYGKIVRYGLTGCDRDSIVVKHVQLPTKAMHPRGWNTDLSHQRKIQSYQIETHWYQKWSKQCDITCRIPHVIAIHSSDNEFFMALEDLDGSGFPVRKSSASLFEMKTCLKWLANFHATFMGAKPEGLWQVGTYWHLDTRPDELKALDDSELKQAAPLIDKKLSASPYQTIVHGDAKLANFCFSKNGQMVAAVDFQYVGGGCGVKDVAYFIGSCLYEKDCERHELELLDWYFSQLNAALKEHKVSVDFDSVEQDWRTMYPLAWTDFHRFIKGWSPGHWKINSYSERVARDVLTQMNLESL